ncbi:MAG: O-antigen ligase family protein [Clostridiales bacterium]|nr:O-antigen ligase family protein [Clostridiales bacterium]
MTKSLLSLGLYVFLFGIKCAGLISIAFGYPGAGGKIAIIIALLLIISSIDAISLARVLQKPFAYILWVGIVLLFFYLYGPQSEYCSQKLTDILLTGTTGIVLFYLLLHSTRIDWLHLGQLGVITALLCYAVAIMLEPSLKPSGILDFGSMRMASFYKDDIFEIRNLIGGLSILSFAFMISSNPDRHINRMRLSRIYLYLIASLIILLWAGSRLPIMTAFIIILSTYFIQARARSRYKHILLIFSAIIALSLAFMISQNMPFIASLSDDTSSLSSRLNRDTNWDAAIRRFCEKPLLGHGLGGYYIEGYSYPGSGTYAHNVILELLSETGILGIILLTIPLIKSGRNYSFRKLVAQRTRNGAALLPVMLTLFLQALVSFELSTNIWLFSFFAVLFMIGSTNRNYEYRAQTSYGK